MYFSMVILFSSPRHRDELEDRLRAITMERSGIRESMVWCLDHAESADEVIFVWVHM